MFCIFRLNLKPDITRSYFLLTISCGANPLLVIPPVKCELSVTGGAARLTYLLRYSQLEERIRRIDTETTDTQES